MFSALPSSPASPASELVPSAPAAPAGPSSNVTPAGEGSGVIPDFAGVFALADAPVATVTAKEGGILPPVVSDEASPASHDPRQKVTSFGGEGPVPRAGRWLKPAVVVPEPAASGANLFAESAPVVVSAASGATVTVEPASPERPARAGSEEKKADEAGPLASASIAPHALVPSPVPSPVPTPVPMSFFPAAPDASFEAAAELEGAGEGGAEPPAFSTQPAQGELSTYPKYTDTGARFSQPSSRRDAIAPKAFASERPAVAPLPQRLVPTPASTSFVPGEALTVPFAVSGNASAVVPAPASILVPAASATPSLVPAPALGSSPRASMEASALPFAGVGYAPAAASAPASILAPAPSGRASPLPRVSSGASTIPFAVSGFSPAAPLVVPAQATIFSPANSLVPATALTPSPVVSAETPAIPFAGPGYSPAFGFSAASLSAPSASLQQKPAPALSPSLGDSANTPVVPFPASGYAPAAVPAKAAVAVPADPLAGGPAHEVVSSPAAISVSASPVAPSPATARPTSFGVSADAPVVPYTASGYAPVAAPARAAASVSVPAASVAIVPASARLESGAQPSITAAPAPVAAVFAAPASAGLLVGLNGNKAEGKNIKQSIDKNVLTETKNEGGTEKAEWRATMQSAAVQAFSSAAVPSAVERVELLPASAFPETPATVASRLVERVAAAAERVESRPAEPVWVRLDLSGEHRVDVKVALRDGRVFADFRTDSDELRAALAQAWDGFVRGREASGTRWAEPVFTASQSVTAPASPTPAPAASFAESNARTDADSGRQSDRREPPPAWNESFAPRSAAPRSAPAVAAVVPVSRPDSSRHLSALA